MQPLTLMPHKNNYSTKIYKCKDKIQKNIWKENKFMEVGIDVNFECFNKFGKSVKEVNKQLTKFAMQLRIHTSKYIPNVKKCCGIYKRTKKKRIRKKQMSRANREIEKWYKKKNCK